MATLIRSDTEERQYFAMEDYLNDKIQTPADLDNIEALLLSVKDQQELLRKQLRETESILGSAHDAVSEHKSLIVDKAHAFQESQADIDRRLLETTSSNNSDEAIAKFDESMRRLQSFDVATAYFELLKEVDNLRWTSLLPPLWFRSLLSQCLNTSLKALQPAAEGAAPHLVDHVEDACRSLWNHMKETLSAELQQALKSLSWPSKNLVIRPEATRIWEEAVRKLLRLQQPEVEANAELAKGQSGHGKPPILLPLEVMVGPLDLRFRYHFESDRPTNRPEKPEYFLKIFALLSQIEGQPQLLSHLIHELISFDTVLRDQWQYTVGHGNARWRGLVWEVLVEKSWFPKWLQVERDFALPRYQEIIDAKDAGEIDYDSVGSGRTKPTKAAIRVNDLLESITDRYRPLESFSQKLRFLIDIQLAIFDQFHLRLQSGLEAYLASTSAVVRAVQGTIGEDRASVEGVKGLERLCRIHGSANYIVQALKDWSDDVFFLELWEELQTRARQNTGENLVGPLTREDIAERTSSAVGSDGESGALFDETAAAYRKLGVRTEEMLVDLLKKTVRDPLRAYSKINPWLLLDAGSSSSTGTISAELEGVLQPLDTCLSFLSRVLGRTRMRHIGRQLSLFLQNSLWDSVMLRHTFSYNGALQFCTDLAATWRVMDNYLGAGQGEVGMRRLSEAAVLLSLGNEAAPDAAGLGFHEAEAEIFANNERARAALDRLGLLVLTESEARSILERRVDVAS
ncbi:MAG: hypothetical protein M1815_003029 [Lichina confinis]|nr:MAG: hypothetical protein M1815_003029 [Lichina confinis]